MAHSLKLIIFTQILLAILASSSRPTPSTPKSTLLSRLKLDVKEEEEGTLTCWDSLFELQSCTGEVILFFLNGETYLGPSCCSAIRTIEHQCWPSMMGTLGFTSQEGDMLRGYCDHSQPGPGNGGTTSIPHQPMSPPPTTTKSGHATATATALGKN